MKAVLKTYTADLHVHTTLSPCAERQMVPEQVFARAIKAGIDVLAITDHNSTWNLPAFLRHCPPGLWVIPGMEVQTKEEIHLVCLFPELDAAMEWGRKVRTLLPSVKNKKTYFGSQTILDGNGKPRGEEELLLLNSIPLSLGETVFQVRRLGGVIYPAHIDRSAFSIISQIGFLPSSPTFTALEISPRVPLAKLRQQYPEHTLIRASDAHALEQIGGKPSRLIMAELHWEEFLLALNQQEQRKVIAN